jgi:hypothetical protein
MTGNIKCYLETGDGTPTGPAKVYITGFNAIPANQADNHIQFNRIFNPPAGDDDILVHVKMHVYDRSGGNLPGTKLLYRELRSVKRIRQDIRTTKTGLSPTVAGNNIAPATGTYTF